MTVKLRYKEPDANESKLLSVGVLDKNNSIEAASENLKFASAVAEFGLLLRDSRYKAAADFGSINNLLRSSTGDDLKNYRSEFVELVAKAQRLKKRG
jgi:Ca-activated chloride channel family protein